MSVVNSAAETIIAYVGGLLATVPGATFYRSRQESVQREENIVINLLPKEENDDQIAEELEKCDFIFEVRVTARAAVPDSAADPIVQACHQAIMADRTLGGRCSKVIKVKKSWQFGEADLNAIVVSVEYRARYMTRVSNGAIVQ